MRFRVLLIGCVIGCDGGNARAKPAPAPEIIKLELAPPPTQPVPAEEQLRVAVSGKILERSECGHAHLLTIDSGLETARTELTVATFDPEFVLGDRRQGRWSLHPVERLAEERAAQWSGCVATADRPTVFVATTKTTYTVLVHVIDRAEIVRQGQRAPGERVELSADEPRGVTLQVGSAKTSLAWEQLQPR